MIGRVTIPVSERADYARMAAAEAARLHEIADVMDEFEFHDLAFDVRMQASEHIDQAAHARVSLGLEGLLA